MRTTEFKDTELGPIPKDWEVRRVGEIGEIVTGATPPRFDGSNWNGDFAWISARDFTEKYIENTVEKVTEKGKRYCRCLPAESVLVTCIASIGLNAICKVPCATNQQINAVVCHDDDPEYFYYAMAHAKGRFASLAGQTAVPIINKQQFSDFALPFPPLPEQRRIAAALGDVDKLIENLNKRVEKKRNLKRGAMQELLTGKRRLRGLCDLGVRKEGLGVSRGERRERGELFTTTTEFKDTELGPIPKDWEVKRLGEIGAFYGGLSGKSSKDFGVGDSRFITFLNVLSNVVIDRRMLGVVNVQPGEKQNLVQKGDLFFNGSSETPEEVAMCAALLEDLPNTYLNSFCCGFRLFDQQQDPLFVSYFFNSEAGREVVKTCAQGLTRYNLSKETFLKQSMRWPKLSEQRAIAAVLSDMDAEIANLEAKLKKMTLLKQGMMQDLLTGKVRLV